MSDMPSDTPTDSATGDRRGRRSGRFPAWAWVLLTIILVILIAILAGVLFWGRGAQDVTPSVSPTASSPTASAPASPAPSTSGDVGQGTFASEMDGFLSDVLNSQNTAVLDQGGTFSNPVIVIVADGSPAQSMTPGEAVAAMDGMFTPQDPEPWDLALPASTIDGYRAGPYGDYFPVGAIVARSNDGHVFSFIGHDSTITTMLMAASEDQLH
jgi:hypothetical protein